MPSRRKLYAYTRNILILRILFYTINTKKLLSVHYDEFQVNDSVVTKLFN